MAVNTPNPEHEKTAAHRQITKSLVGGTQAMRKMRTLYLPQEPRETETAYDNRLERSVLTNFYKKTRDTFVGRVMKKVALRDDTPASIQDIAEDIDNAGNDIVTFGKRVVTAAVDDGVAFILVDAPEFRAEVRDTEDGPVPVQRTRAMDEALGIRPFVNLITAENMLGLRVNDRQELEMVRFRTYDRRPDPDDPYVDVEIEQIHVLSLLVTEDRSSRRVLKETYEFEKDDNASQEGAGDWVLVDDVVTDFENIPLVIMYTDKVCDFVGMPLFMDLANLNIRHWQSASDQANIVHVARVPILFATGLVDESAQKPQSVTIAANSVIHGEPGSELKYVEHTGKSAEVGFKELEILVQDIIAMGVEIVLNQRPGSQTATGRALDQAEADTLMNAVADAVENAFAEVFIFLAEAFGEEVGDDGAGGLNLNKDYALQTGDAAQMVTQLINLWSSSGISHRALIEELKRRDVLSEDFDYEEDETLIEAEREQGMDREAEMIRRTTEASQPLDGEDDDDDEDEDDEE